MRFAIGYVFAFLLVGCADLRPGYEKELADEQVPTDATVVIGRFMLGNTYAPTVFVNDEPKCSLEDKTYCILRLPPGNYRFRMNMAKYQQFPQPAKYRLPSELVLPMQVDAGATSFMRFDSDLNRAIPIILPGVIAISGRLKIFAAPMTKEQFIQMRPEIERVKPL